jgi:hypothetical protein
MKPCRERDRVGGTATTLRGWTIRISTTGRRRSSHLQKRPHRPSGSPRFWSNGCSRYKIPLMFTETHFTTARTGGAQKIKFSLDIPQLVGYIGSQITCSINVHQRFLLSLSGHVSTLLPLGLQHSDRIGNRLI